MAVALFSKVPLPAGLNLLIQFDSGRSVVASISVYQRDFLTASKPSTFSSEVFVVWCFQGAFMSQMESYYQYYYQLYSPSSFGLLQVCMLEF